MFMRKTVADQQCERSSELQILTNFLFIMMVEDKWLRFHYNSLQNAYLRLQDEGKANISVVDPLFEYNQSEI